MATPVPENGNAHAPRGASTSAGPPTFIPVRHLWAMARARIRGLLPGGERAALCRVMRTGLGSSISPQELNRLALAAAVYRALARADRAAPGVLALQSPGVAITPQAVVVVPATPFRAVIEQVLSESSVRIVYTPAPRHDRVGFQRAVSLIDAGAPLAGLYPFRTGPVAVAWRGRSFDPGWQEKDIAEFADGCLTENPAQYGWLEETP